MINNFTVCLFVCFSGCNAYWKAHWPTDVDINCAININCHRKDMRSSILVITKR